MCRPFLKDQAPGHNKAFEPGAVSHTPNGYLGTFENHFPPSVSLGMNEAGLNARVGQEGYDSQGVPGVHQERAEPHEGTPVGLPGDVRRPLQPGGYAGWSPPPTVWPSMTRRAIPILSLAGERAIRRITPTVPIFPWIIRRMYLTLWTSRMSFRPCIHPEPCSTRSWARRCLTGRRQPTWCARLLRITSCLTIPLSPTYSICKSHGYLIGEHFTCPICGEKAEVYSRITGYYRPVQNWNEGKSQEYKNRTNYNIRPIPVKSMACPESRLIPERTDIAGNREAAHQKAGAPGPPVSFHHQDLSQLRIRKGVLKGTGITRLLMRRSILDLAEKFGIMQAPTPW